MLMICKNMFDIGDIYLVESEHFELHGHTYAYDDLVIKRLTPQSSNDRGPYAGSFIYLVSNEEYTYSIKEIYKEGDTYEIFLHRTTP